MPDTIEFILQKSGQIVRRDVQEYPVEVTPDAIRAIVDSQPVLIDNVLPPPPEADRVFLRVGAGIIQWSLVLTHMRLRAPFHLKSLAGDNKVLVPDFGSANSPKLDVVWTVPDSMDLVLTAALQTDGNVYWHHKVWLFAFDDDNKAYTLPLANLYDDGTVCTGDFVSTDTNQYGCLMKCLTQFSLSRWNGDLFTTNKVRGSEVLFQFMPETLAAKPYSGKWTTHCEKVASATVERALP